MRNIEADKQYLNFGWKECYAIAASVSLIDLLRLTNKKSKMRGFEYD
ncbi:hypothetical protein ACOWPH_00295 [Anabaena sp. PCC 7938]